ncbi:MAG: hypothetical protein MMC23_008324 [Stictis urceolatum]|nr:hypothetical protein [Stictis urceolata]
MDAERSHLLGRTETGVVGSDHDTQEVYISEGGDADRMSGIEGNSSKKRMLLIAGPALLLSTSIVSFDLSFLSTNYSRRIATSLHDLNNAGWIILAGSITESAFQPLYGHLAQLYGRRKALLMACSAMAVGLLFCSLSPRLWQLTLSRVISGTGSSGIQLLVMIIINDAVKLQDLALWKSGVVVAQTFALMLGGPIGSIFADAYGWNATFGLELVVMLITIAGLFFTLQEPVRQKYQSTPKRIDYYGAASLFLAVATPLFAINIGGNILPWSHPAVIVLLCLTPPLVFVFYRVETKAGLMPILPMKFIKMPSALAVFACAFAVVFAFNQLIYSFALYIEARALGHESTYIDWALTFVHLGRPVGVFFSGLLIKRLVKFKRMLQINIVVNLILYLTFAFGWISAEHPGFAPYLVFLGINLGVSESCLLVSLLCIVGKEEQAQLYAFFDLILAIAGDMGIAVSLALTRAFVRGGLKEYLGDNPGADHIIEKALEGLHYIGSLRPDVQAGIVHAYIGSIERVFGLSCVVLLFGLAASFRVREMTSI